jgi:hypothetical protein
MAASRAPAREAWSNRAASLTWRWLRAETTVGKVTALTNKMMNMTNSSSTRVNPRRNGPILRESRPMFLEIVG